MKYNKIGGFSGEVKTSLSLSCGEFSLSLESSDSFLEIEILTPTPLKGYYLLTKKEREEFFKNLGVFAMMDLDLDIKGNVIESFSFTTSRSVPFRI